MPIKEAFEKEIKTGSVIMTWINSYSGLMIRSPCTTLIIDPMGIYNLNQYEHVDAIIITHEHSDHFDPNFVCSLQEKTGAQILTTPYISKKLNGNKSHSLQIGDFFPLNDLILHAEYCDHPGNQPLSFVISTEDGINIYHPSDSDPFASMTEIRRKYRPQILIYVSVSPKKAAQIATMVKPEVVITYYTDELTNPRYIKEIAKENPEIKTKLIRRFEVYQYPDQNA